MLVIAHRGFSSQYTENTIIAFQQALKLKVDVIELDIHQVEHEFLVFHDPYLNKLTNGEGRIFDMPLDQARQLRLKIKTNTDFRRSCRAHRQQSHIEH